ncbi:VOC family protein [Sphaerisporangium dianthi]|uniref:VOC family protein n=1 Tax=Sphaerisporangium dianthi TaxID=1436120 RepID=A0ABV9CC90_9ACTN
MLRGMATANYWADDLEEAKKWYTEVLGVAPYFERPGYAEFRVGDYEHEFGLVDARYRPGGPPPGPAGGILYWHVDDVEATVARLLSLGAKEYEPPTERGPGFFTASVVDPFGNILGVMYNVHYLKVVDASRAL